MHSRPRHLLPGLAAAGALTASLGTPPAGGADWPQWRGPHRDGKSPETGLLASWPEGGPPLDWKTEGIGAGFSSVSVAEGRIFTMGDLEDGQYAMALREDGGALLWKARVGPVHDDERGGPRATPTVDGDLVFVLGTSGDVVCLEAATGRERWRHNLPADFGGFLMKAMGSYDWRFSESPLVDGDKVIVTPGHVEAVMVALERSTGKEVWRTQGGRLGARGSDGAAYASAVVSHAAGVKQYVQLVGRGLIGVDAGSGELLWGYNPVANDIANIPTPIVQGDYVFSSTGYGTGSGLVRIKKVMREGEDGEQREGLEAEEVYFLPATTMQNHHGGIILLDGTLFTGTGHNKGFPLAVDFMTGEVAWGPVRNQGRDSAAVTYADGRLYFRYQDGRMILVEATPETYREHGSFVIPDVTKPSWSHPVIANGKLLLREQDRLFAYDIAASASAAGATSGTL